jgi:hypothetical protein
MRNASGHKPLNEGNEESPAYESPLIVELGDVAELTKYGVSVRVP